MNEYLARRPFDIYQLQLFRLVAERGGFTAAARAAGLTQSAVTRQIARVEEQLGVPLLIRTTRTARPTAAGLLLLEEAGRILGDVDALLRRLREEHAEAPREVRIGVSRTVSLSHLPGFFFPNRRDDLLLSRVSHDSGASILEALEQDRLDLGVLCPPARLSPRLRVAHRFRDVFTLVAHRDIVAAAGIDLRSRRRVAAWLAVQPWLLIGPESQTGRRLHAWLARQGWKTAPAVELDTFDLAINLAALGLGVSLVPQRALALYTRKRALQRIPWPAPFSRELAVLTRRHPKPPPHVSAFIERILF